MKKRLIAICLLATILMTANSVAAATQNAAKMGLLASVLAETETNEPENTVSTWDRIWPILIAVGSFFLFRFLRSRQNDDY